MDIQEELIPSRSHFHSILPAWDIGSDAKMIHISSAVPDSLSDIEPPPSGTTEVYTDGGCAGNPGPCGAGALLRTVDSYHEAAAYVGAPRG